jgi:hypothetical protein
MRALALSVALAGGMIVPLDYRAIEDALTIGNSSIESTHRKFHGAYRVTVNTAPVDFLSIVTPFRRVVLLAGTEKRQGRRIVGQREALKALEPDAERLEVYAELTFHPFNTFVGVPDYSIELEPFSFKGPSIPPAFVDRIPRFGPRIDDPVYPFPYPHPGGPRLPVNEPLRGATIIGSFAGGLLDPKAIYTVVVKNGTEELSRSRVDLARLR